jgi:hypothetical protein
MNIINFILLSSVVAISQDQIDGIKTLAGSDKWVTLNLNHDQVEHASEISYEHHEQRRLVSRHNTDTTGVPVRQLDTATSIDSSEVPLFIGTGTHYANLYVGSPPQRVSVIVDTGSHHTAFPCSGCQSCGDHTDPYFNPSASKTSRKMQGLFLDSQLGGAGIGLCILGNVDVNLCPIPVGSDARCAF